MLATIRRILLINCQHLVPETLSAAISPVDPDIENDVTHDRVAYRVLVGGIFATCVVDEQHARLRKPKACPHSGRVLRYEYEIKDAVKSRIEDR